MKFLIKYLLKFHRGVVLDAVVSDYFGEIPRKVTDNAITILDEKRVRVEQWLQYQAFHLQRQMVSDPAKAEVIFGMLLQLKIWSHMISHGRALPEQAEGTKPASAAEKDRERREDLAKALEGAKTFAAGKQK